MEVHITSVERIQRTSKNTGKPFTAVVIRTREHGDKKISGFANVDNADWEVGSVAEIDIEEKGQYLNFKTPRADHGPAARSPETAELKNILTMMILPAIDQNKSAITEIKFLVQALGDRLEKLITPEPEDDFQDPTI